MNYMKRVFKIAGKCLLVLFCCFIALVLGLTICAKSERTKALIGDRMLFAHRGQTFEAAENSIEAIRFAKEDGYEGVEIDVRVSKDGKVMLFHDDTMERMCGRKGGIEDFTSRELENVRLYFKGRKTESKIADLETVFRLFPDLVYYIDVKEPTRKNLDIICDLIRKYDMEQKAIVAHAMFIPNILHRIKNPDILCCNEGFNPNQEWKLKLFPKNLQADFYSGFIEKTNRKQMCRLRKMGQEKRKIAYSVDKESFCLGAKEYGLHYMIVDLENPQPYLDKWQDADKD